MTDETAAPVIDTLAPGVPRAAPHAPASAGAQIAWLLLDASRSPYVAFVNIFVFSAYFTTVVVADPVRGQILWSYITVATAIGLALGAPLLGAIADAGGRRKPWIAGCIVVGIPCMSALWFATPGMTAGIGWVIAALIVANLAFEFSAVLLQCDADVDCAAGRHRASFRLRICRGEFHRHPSVPVLPLCLAVESAPRVRIEPCHARA